MDAEQLAVVRRLAAPEDAPLAAVRNRAEQVTTPPPPEVGALLSLLAGARRVRHAVEVGTAGGVTAAWLLRGMDSRGVLTSIEGDTHIHGLATAAFDEVGIGDRVRSILGNPGDVATRLSDGQYDLVILQANATTDVRLITQVERLLSPGGMLVARRVMASADGPSAILEAVAADPWAEATVLPIDDGLLLARLTDATDDV